MEPVKIAVLVSGAGRGSNMAALIKGCKDGVINGSVSLVIGVREDSSAIARAKEEGCRTVIISPKAFEREEDYQNAVYGALTENSIDLICLAGYMRLLGDKVLEGWKNRIMNVHPSLLPSFCGKGMYGHHVHEAALKRGVKYSGCTVHIVDETYDTGPIVKQTVVPVEPGDTPDSLAARILPNEHKTYVECVRLFSLGRLEVKDGIVYIK
ncbi:MAG: phosphoribosylglycinamide formyltransferase [Abditibacteriota bacterium]|nr:phosphoribosylglycinamide formyltransferase [Abditibacteriota bacterium]